MFTRARLHLTLLYAALLGLTVVLIAGAIGALSVHEERQADDRELAIRAEAILSSLPPGPPPSPTGPPEPGREFHPTHLEGQGLLEYVLPVAGGQVVPPPSSFAGLPDLAAADQAVKTGRGIYRTVDIDGSQVRLYALPDMRTGTANGVIEVARSQFFVNAAAGDIVLVALASGAIGLIISAAAGYWLAGRTLRPIAETLERQRNFAADASHELRTPLTVMLTNAELLTLHPERRLAEYQDVVADIVEEIRRLGRLVSDLLTLARADQGRAMIARGPVDLSDLALTGARQFMPVATGKGLELRTVVEPAVFVEGDRDRLQQLAVILVDNAVRYTGAGGVEVRVAHQGRDAVFSVSDSGPGIAPEHLPHLFERFYRIDAARTADQGGTGLGLALAKWIADAHGGHLDVVSTPGRGSAFRFRLAAVRPASRPQSPAPQPAERQ